MDPTRPTPLLGGLAPADFARRHWHKRPLLVRRAIADVVAPLGRTALFGLAAREEVESRLVWHDEAGWHLRHGPFARRALPPLRQRGWTLLVQGLDLHVPAAHELLARFRFLPDARLDDLMISYASDGGGVGPHVDSYDVFLLQVQGRRRWRIGRPGDAALVAGAPLKILRRFEPEQEWLLEPGDMLYLPPHWAHEGVAEGECMTCSIGFRAGTRASMARELLQALLDDEGAGAPSDARRYADPGQPATAQPACIPAPLQAFALDGVRRLLDQPRRLEQALGEVLSEPKPGVWFEPASPGAARIDGGVRLDRRSRMLYDRHSLYLNGESWRASGADARLMRRLADERALPAEDLRRASDAARSLLRAWCEAGWLHAWPSTAGAGRRERR